MTYMTYQDLGRGRTGRRAFAWFGTAFDRIRSRYAAWRADRDRRDAFASLLGYDDRMLSDMGVLREDVEWAASLPLYVNAALALRDRSSARQAVSERARSRRRRGARRTDDLYSDEARRLGVPR
jgi:hypothetical protein